MAGQKNFFQAFSLEKVFYFLFYKIVILCYNMLLIKRRKQMTKYTYEVYKDVKDYQKDLLEFLTENKQAGQSIENEINKLRNKTPGYEDIEFNDKIDFYNFLIERFYPNTSPMEVENLDPQLNKKIAKAIAKLMKRIA